MISLARVAATAAAGAAAMYWLDPDNGRRRRALARDRISSAAASVSDLTGAGSRDLKHRAQGMSARVRSRLSRDDASNEILEARVRAALGRAVSNSGAIEVLASGGRITLVGPVLQREYEQLLGAVQAVRGVVEVEDHLSVWERPEGVPGLQGSRSLRGDGGAVLRERWSPATRMLAGASGAGLLIIGLREIFGTRPHALIGSAGLAFGGAMVLRSWTNVPLTRLAGGSGRRAIDIRKTLVIRAPLEQVFSALASFENFPRFMRNVRSVRMHADGRSHWEVAGPAGISVEWDSETTVSKPNELLAWRSVPGSTVAHAGIMRFERDGDGTRLDIQMTYKPPAGALGHAAAKLFGADPKRELDEDLLRLKSFLESGVRPRDAAQSARPADARA
jgi:uncharacterized membrane protein